MKNPLTQSLLAFHLAASLADGQVQPKLAQRYRDSNMRMIRVWVMLLAFGITFSLITASIGPLSAQSTGASHPHKRMADGKEWTTHNLNVKADSSYCYDGAESKCRQYGRLYTWESALRVCQSLGDGWRLPADADWRQMAKHYGGVSEDSDDKGKAAYKALLNGGDSGFNALLGGGRSENGEYARLEAHGFYWTTSEIDAATAWSYNFGKGGQALHRQRGLEKESALSVRCVRSGR